MNKFLLAKAREIFSAKMYPNSDKDGENRRGYNLDSEIINALKKYTAHQIQANICLKMVVKMLCIIHDSANLCG